VQPLEKPDRTGLTVHIHWHRVKPFLSATGGMRRLLMKRFWHRRGAQAMSSDFSRNKNAARSMPPIEIEVKFLLLQKSALRQRLLDLNLHHEGPVFETNIRFEDAENSLVRNHRLLRLRTADRNTLTFKSPPEQQDVEFKILQELEVEIGDPEAMARILEFLGFRKAQVYEKYRETFFFENAICCLDRMPYGDFLEIEGSRTAIRKVSKLLDLDWNRRIVRNYLEIFEIIKTREALSFSDVTFSNFQGIVVDIEKALSLHPRTTIAPGGGPANQ
jgi:adenylate cyclase class 2